MTLPILPMLIDTVEEITVDQLAENVDLIYRYLQQLHLQFANAAGSAIDPSLGQGGDSSLTITDTPDPITYTPGVTLSADGTAFGYIDVTYTIPDRAVDVIVLYREEDTTEFKQSYASMSPFRLISLKPDVTYELMLAGQAANGALGPFSELTQVNIALSMTVGVPTDLQAVATYQSIVLTWVAPVPSNGLFLYEVQRADDVDFTMNAVQWSVLATKFVDDTGVIGSEYFYRVQSVDKIGNVSAWSDVVYETTLNVPDNSIFTAKIVDANVTYAKIQDVTESRLNGRGQGDSDGPMEELTAGTGLLITGTQLTATFPVVVPIGDPLGSQITTGDGKMFYTVGPELNGMNLVYVGLSVSTVSSSGKPTYQLRRVRAGSSDVDMLSTKVEVEVNEIDSVTAATQPVINTSNDDVATGDQIHFDKDVAGTGELGDQVRMRFALPLV